MERDFDTFDPNDALVDEGRNLYYPAGWQKGDPVFVLNEPTHDTECDDYSHGPDACACICHEPQRGLDNYCPDCGDDLSLIMNHICGIEQRKGLDCE